MDRAMTPAPLAWPGRRKARRAHAPAHPVAHAPAHPVALQRRWPDALQASTLVLTLVLMLLSAPLVRASTGAQGLPSGAALRGEATLRFLGLPVYDARLFTPGGQALNWRQDFALELAYRRGFSQRDLVESTLKEFDRLGDALPLRQDLQRCYQAVAPGDRYLAVTRGADQVMFWRNGSKTCTLRHPGIKTRFMSIFLGQDTRDPGFTRRLLGQ